MDVPSPPVIVLVRPAPCGDADKAEELLRRSLAPAQAPREAWSVVARFGRKRGGLEVEGEITDEVGAPVAHRVLTDAGAECSPLARAVGAWASLVLDAEMDRAAKLAPPPPPPPAPVVEARPIPPDKPAPERALLLVHPEGERTLELGFSMFLMGGTGSGVLAGPTLFGVVEAGRGWFLRPAIFLGRTLEELSPTSDVYATLVAARFDACGRIPGFYIDRHGIQLDVCGGSELGFSHFDAPSMPPPTPGTPTSTAPTSPTQPFFSVGPSINLRGELGNGLALMIRGVGGLNILRDSFIDNSIPVDPSWFVGRAELGLSWQLR